MLEKTGQLGLLYLFGGKFECVAASQCKTQIYILLKFKKFEGEQNCISAKVLDAFPLVVVCEPKRETTKSVKLGLSFTDLSGPMPPLGER